MVSGPAPPSSGCYHRRSQCIAADGAIAGDVGRGVAGDVDRRRLAREAGGADRPHRRAASKQGSEKQDGSVARKPAKARPDASTRSPKEGLSCPATH